MDTILLLWFCGTMNNRNKGELVIMKLKEIDKLNYAIKSLLDDTTVALSAKIKFQLLTIMKQLEPHIESISVVSDEKIREYGTQGEDGQYKIDIKDTETFSKFQTDMNELLESEADIPLKKLKASEILNINIPSKYLVTLYEIIEEDL